MKVVPASDLLKLDKKDNRQSLWSFLDFAQNNNFISEKEKKEYINWINQVNYKHHNDVNFYENLKQIFVEDGVSHIIEGQEDLGAIGVKNVAVIVRNAEMGVAFTLTKMDSNPINQEDWVNYQKILSALDLGFINPKDFHLLKSFDNINNELKLKDSVKEHKVKI